MKIKNYLVDFLSELDEKTRTLIIAVTIFAIILIYFLFIFLPIKGSINLYRNKIDVTNTKLKSVLKELKKLDVLKSKISDVQGRCADASLSVTEYIGNKAAKMGINVKSTKATSGKVSYGIAVNTVELKFMETNVNDIAKFIMSVENDKYYFRVLGVTLEDPDENGLVSGTIRILAFVKGS